MSTTSPTPRKFGARRSLLTTLSQSQHGFVNLGARLTSEPVVVLASILAVSLATPSGPELHGFESLTVRPSQTDSKITEFDSPHMVFFDKDAKAKNELLLFLPGTNGKPGREDKFCTVAAQEGFQVISLMYPDSIPAAVVRRSAEKDAFLNFRLEVIEGKDLSTYVKVDRTNSIENRL